MKRELVRSMVRPLPVSLALILLGAAVGGTVVIDRGLFRNDSRDAASGAGASVQATETALAAGASIRAAAPTPVDPASLPLYQIYQAAEGDTVDAVAARFGIAPEYIFANNDSLTTPFLIPGQHLTIPAGNGILHEVRYGETLTDIAAEYDVEPNAIRSFPANHLANSDDLMSSEMIFIPGAHVPTPAASTPPSAR